jgi:hypothetical protein
MMVNSSDPMNNTIPSQRSILPLRLINQTAPVTAIITGTDTRTTTRETSRGAARDARPKTSSTLEMLLPTTLPIARSGRG